MSKTIKIIVTISILLNVVLLTFTAVSFLRHQERAQQSAQERPKISEASRQKIKEKFSNADKTIRPQMQKVREKSNALKDIISAPEFDKTAYEAAIDDIMMARQTIARERAIKMGEAMADLPVSERQKLMHGLMRSLSPPTGGGKHEGRERPMRWHKEGERPASGE